MAYAGTQSRAALLTRAGDAVHAVADWAARVRVGMPRPIRWFMDDPRRMLTVAWMVGLIVAGCARAAVAEPIIVGPDLAHGGPKTLFETYDFLTYKLTILPDDQHSDWFGLSQGMLQVVGFINNLILWACLGILYGALTLLQWFLNLTFYRDSAGQIDTATQMIANQIFWPLIAATVAIGAFMAYARWRGEGRGFVSDLGWVIAAGVIAVGFAAGPSRIMTDVDSLRQDMAAGIITGASQYASDTTSPTGFPTPVIGGTPQEVGTRKLVDGLWSTFGATPWCLAEFHELEICRVAGSHALADDDQWKAWMIILNIQGAVPEFQEYGDWVRGQDMTRTGYMLLLALITIPMALMLLRLVISGLIAVVGLLLMLVIGLLFLVTWPIPGWFRQTGTRYWVYTLGLELQGLFITVVISGDMAVAAIISTRTGKYGFFIVALLNLALMAAAMKARSWLEMLTTTGGAGSMGIGTALLIRSVARTVMSAGAGMVSGGASVAGAGLGAVARAGKGPGWGQQPGAKTSRFGVRTVKEPRGMAPLSSGPLTATSSRAGAPGSPPVAGRTSAAVGAGTGPGRAVAAGTRPVKRQALEAARGGSHRELVSSHPTVVDGKLVRNVQRSQGKTGRQGRVWVDKRGAGLSKLDTTPPPPAALTRRGAYQITKVGAPGERLSGPS